MVRMYLITGLGVGHWLPADSSTTTHLPHLAVILLHRLPPEAVGHSSRCSAWSDTLLLVCFPIAGVLVDEKWVFQLPHGAVASRFLDTFFHQHVVDHWICVHDSYLWRGWGMYTQLWAMPLSFIALACLYRLIDQGKELRQPSAPALCLVLSHLAYLTYMVAIAAIILISCLNRESIRRCLGRYTIVAVLVLAITSYLWVAFIAFKEYRWDKCLRTSWKYNSFGAAISSPGLPRRLVRL